MKKMLGILLAGTVLGVGLAYGNNCGGAAAADKTAVDKAVADTAAAMPKTCSTWTPVTTCCNSLNLDEKKAAAVNAIIDKYTKLPCNAETCKAFTGEMGKILTEDQMKTLKATMCPAHGK